MKTVSSRRLLSRLLIMLVVALWLVACGGGEPEVPPAPPTLVVSNLVSTLEVEPTTPPTVAPTTTLPPPPTVAAPATATPVPTATPNPAVNLLTAEDFGDTYNPLTGEEVEDTAVLQRRPIAFKVPNAPPRSVRPQSGLNEADIIFEHITEALVTRFTVIVFGQDPETVGPLRSARLIDVEIPAMYDAALAFSGAGIGVSRRLNESDFRNRILRSTAEGYYRTGDTTKALEHTLYARPEGLRNALAEVEENNPPNFNGQRMTFTSEPPPGGTPASVIDINYREETVTWEYDPATNFYYRLADGEPHLDGNTNEQVRTRNVVVVFANHQNDPSICEQVNEAGECLLLSVEIQLWGQGRAIVFRDGLQYEATWKREARNDMLTFYDANDNPIPLQIGNTWMQVMSIYYNNPVTVTE